MRLIQWGIRIIGSNIRGRENVKTIMISTIAVVALAGSAHAEGFQGLYAGVFGSKGKGQLDVTSSGPAAIPLSGLKQPLHAMKGYSGGLDGGFNWQRGNLVLGFEGDLAFSSTGAVYRVARQTKPPTPPTLAGDIRNIFDIRGRIGYASDQTLLYAFGGAAQAKTDVTATSFSPTRTDRVSNTHSGSVYGAGIAQQVNDNVSFVFEYDKFNLGSQPYNFPAASKFGNNEVKLRESELRAGISIHFN
jgi:outer membrane immunogenic protein